MTQTIGFPTSMAQMGLDDFPVGRLGGQNMASCTTCPDLDSYSYPSFQIHHRIQHQDEPILTRPLDWG